MKAMNEERPHRNFKGFPIRNGEHDQRWKWRHVSGVSEGGIDADRAYKRFWSVSGAFLWRLRLNFPLRYLVWVWSSDSKWTVMERVP